MSIESLTRTYSALRAAKTATTQEYDAKLRNLNKSIAALESQILGALNGAGLKSAKNEHGVFTRTETRKYHAADWQALYDHIVETKNFGLLQKRLGEGATKEFIEAEGNMPPGVSFTDIVGVHFTKPKA